jgi:predicted dehydrogenase
MKTLNVAVVGTGWIGSIRAYTGAGQPIVENLYIAEIRPEVAEEEELLGRDLDAVLVSTAPETTH